MRGSLGFLICNKRGPNKEWGSDFHEFLSNMVMKVPKPNKKGGQNKVRGIDFSEHFW